MPQPSVADRLAHALEAIEQIERHTAGLDLSAFQKDRFLQLGVERCLEIISEASRHIPEPHRLRHPDIPWRQVADIGNRIRHAYHAIDSAIIWAVVEYDLKELKAAIEDLRSGPI